jgi:hypothetical protein
VSSVRLRMGPQPCLLRAVVSAESTFRPDYHQQSVPCWPKKAKIAQGSTKAQTKPQLSFLTGPTVKTNNIGPSLKYVPQPSLPSLPSSAAHKEEQAECSRTSITSECNGE